jgi:hypothetical protein
VEGPAVRASRPLSANATARRRIAAVEEEFRALASLKELLPQYRRALANRPDIERQVALISAARSAAQDRLNALGAVEQPERSSELAAQALSLIALIREGRRIGLVEHHCLADYDVVVHLLSAESALFTARPCNKPATKTGAQAGALLRRRAIQHGGLRSAT